MNAMTLWNETIQWVGSNLLVERLVLASVEAMVLALIVVAVMRVAQVKSPRFRALLWLLVMAKPVLSLVVGSPIPLVQLEKPPVQAVATNGGDLDAMMEAQLARDTQALAARPATTSAATGLEEGREVSPDESASVGLDGTTSRSIQISAAQGAALVWLAGAVVLLCVALVDTRRLRSLRRQSQAAPGEVQRLYAEEAAELKLQRLPALRLTHDLESPALIGIVRPDVYLPAWLVEEGEPERLRWLLRHELMHARLNDPVALLARRAAEILFFFHPVVWVAGKKWEEAMELACDRALIGSEEEAREYAEQLYKVLENQHHRQKLAMAGGLFATRTQIGKRIAALLTNPMEHPARLSAMSLGALAVMAIVTATTGLGFRERAVARSAEEAKVIATREEAAKSLKAMATAIYAYQVDWNDRPPRLESLTSPIAYITGMLPDPFAPGRVLPIVAENNRVYTYSVGPDGVDDGGQLIYDPENGVASSGDMVWVVRPGDDLTYKLYEPTPTPRPPLVYENRADMTDDIVRDAIRRTRSDLRSLHTAIESYRVDYDVYADKLTMLTSPIAYMTAMFPDPFAPYRQEGAVPADWNGDLRLRYNAEMTKGYLYGIGPDGVDNNADLEYDPTNGSISDGDLVRTLEVGIQQRVRDPDLAAMFADSTVRLQVVQGAVKAWAITHEELPEEQEIVGSEFLKTMPNDPFDPGKPVRYALSDDQKTVRLYSIGPDGDDDRGLTEPVGVITRESIPSGDIVETVSLDEILRTKHPEPGSPATKSNEMLNDLLELKEKEGRDNGLIHYTEGADLMPAVPQGLLADRIKKVMTSGWSEGDEELLGNYLVLWRPALAKIRKGTAVGYAHGIGAEKGAATPVPNFLYLQLSGKMLVVEGKRFESEGRFVDAMNNYLTVMEVARDLTSEGNTLISHLIAYAMRNYAARPIAELVHDDNLDRDQIMTAYRRLRQIDEDTLPVREAFKSEGMMMRKTLEDYLAKLQANPPDPQMETEMVRLAEEKHITRSEFISMLQKSIENYNETWAKMYGVLDKSFAEQSDPAFNEAITNSLRKSETLLPNVFPNFLEASTRALVAGANTRMAMAEMVLALYRLDKGRAPATLDQAATEDGLLLPKDPFSDKPFGYTPIDSGADFALYSVGPDLKVQSDATNYDPTNGTISAGDIFSLP